MSIGVPSGASVRSLTMLRLNIRTQPCDTARPISWGSFVPWMPTTPPTGQSLYRA